MKTDLNIAWNMQNTVKRQAYLFNAGNKAVSAKEIEDA